MARGQVLVGSSAGRHLATNTANTARIHSWAAWDRWRSIAATQSACKVATAAFLEGRLCVEYAGPLRPNTTSSDRCLRHYVVGISRLRRRAGHPGSMELESFNVEAHLARVCRLDVEARHRYLRLVGGVGKPRVVVVYAVEGWSAIPRRELTEPVLVHNVDHRAVGHAQVLRGREGPDRGAVVHEGCGAAALGADVGAHEAVEGKGEVDAKIDVHAIGLAHRNEDTAGAGGGLGHCGW